jgi:ABC-type uncharacterized transport system involved in gliding motility auxiliary subunit
VNGSKFIVPLITHYHTKHPITENFSAQTFFPLVGSVKSTLNPEFNFIPLAQTNKFPSSWAENNYTQVLLGQIQYNEDKDEKGPLSIMAAIEEKKNGPNKKKIVVVGNSSFVENLYSHYNANFDLFLKAVSWLVDEDFAFPSLPERAPTSPLMLSAPEVGIIFYFSIIFGPAILLLWAFFIYKRRQSL